MAQLVKLFWINMAFHFQSDPLNFFWYNAGSHAQLKQLSLHFHSACHSIFNGDKSVRVVYLYMGISLKFQCRPQYTVMSHISNVVRIHNTALPRHIKGQLNPATKHTISLLHGRWLSNDMICFFPFMKNWYAIGGLGKTDRTDLNVARPGESTETCCVIHGGIQCTAGRLPWYVITITMTRRTSIYCGVPGPPCLSKKVWCPYRFHFFIS